MAALRELSTGLVSQHPAEQRPPWAHHVPKWTARKAPLAASSPASGPSSRRRSADGMCRSWKAEPMPSRTDVDCKRQAASVRGGTSRIHTNTVAAEETAHT